MVYGLVISIKAHLRHTISYDTFTSPKCGIIDKRETQKEKEECLVKWFLFALNK